MIEKILPGIFRVELPLPDLSLQTVNVYVIKGKKRNLIVDSGMDTQECKKALLKALQKLDIKLENTDFFITHLHEDHFGLAPEMTPANSKIYINAPEATYLGIESRWEDGFVHGKKNGFPEKELNKFFRDAPDFFRILPLEEMKDALDAHKKGISPQGRVRIIDDEEVLNIGNYSLQSIMTPGHTSGHTCLYEPEKKLLFSGDHILETITPAIFFWPGESRNPLYEFLRSLDKVNSLKVDLVLPGHRNTFRNHRARIAELKTHHYQREQEIESMLLLNGKRGRNAYEIASEVTWNIPQPWNEFTTMLKWMALAETLSHLKFMESQKKITSRCLNDELKCYFWQQASPV